MNEKAEVAAHPEAGNAIQPSGKPEDESGPSTTQAAGAAAHASAGPSLFQRVTGLFRQRNGTSLREEIADALAETASDAESFSPGERAMLNNILRLREVR